MLVRIATTEVLFLTNLASIASIATAVVAVLSSAYYFWICRNRKRLRLERYLERRTVATKTQYMHSMIHLTAAIGMSEADILQAAFDSQFIERETFNDPSSGLTTHVLLWCKSDPFEKNTKWTGIATVNSGPNLQCEVTVDDRNKPNTAVLVIKVLDPTSPSDSERLSHRCPCTTNNRQIRIVDESSTGEGKVSKTIITLDYKRADQFVHIVADHEKEPRS